MTTLETLALALGLLCTLALAWIRAWSRFHSSIDRRSGGAQRSPYPISILKPLRGTDEGLEQNLRSILEQNYPCFEVIFGAEQADDPALKIAAKLEKEYPLVAIQVVHGSACDGYNPKVRILRHMMGSARFNWVLVSDSNVRPGPDYLSKMQKTQAQTDAALVHSRLSATSARGLGGRLEELQLNTWIATAIQFADTLGRPCVIGKSMLMEVSALRSIGGLESVKNLLAEDYAIGHKMSTAGFKVTLCKDRLPVVVGTPGFQGFFNRHVRWGQMRRHISPMAFLFELLSNPTPFLLCVLLFGQESLAPIAATVLALKWLGDLQFYLQESQNPSLRSAALLPLRDCLVPILWAVSAVSTRVNWRGNALRVGPKSRLSPIERRAALEGERTLAA